MTFSVDGGRVPQARWRPSPNCNDRPPGCLPELLVLHNISLPPGEFGNGCIESFFCNALETSAHPWFANIAGLQVSAHFLVDRAGQVTQFVNCDQRAWHAGVSRFHGRDACNDFSIGIELEGTDTTPYSDAQYRALSALIPALFAAYPRLSVTAIVGHSDIAPGRKTDPGPAFDWSRLRRDLVVMGLRQGASTSSDAVAFPADAAPSASLSGKTRRGGAQSMNAQADHGGSDTVTGPGRVALTGGTRDELLVFTVAFHPGRELIGTRAEFPLRPSGNAITLGRDGPAFSLPGSDPPRALLDPHVSRRAVRITGGRLQWQVTRLQGSSRLSVDGRDTFDHVVIDAARLRAGVRLMLAHSVVLLMRLEPASGLAAECATVNGMLGSSAYTRSLAQQVARAAAIDSDVLLLGPTGTGKDLLARSIHAQSRRASAPMVAVNMAAIPAELSAATLFGAARGAFTGATDRRLGYFEQADGGTLFLDEIGDAPLALQPQLLRALEQREVQVVGGDIRPFDARIISATDTPINEEGADFRAALRHRLGAVEIRLLPLCEHPEDIGLLAAHYLALALQESRGEDLWRLLADSPLAVGRCAALFDLLLAHDWPGNVRELVNILRQVAISADGDMQLPAELVDRLSDSTGAGDTGASPAMGTGRRRERPLDEISEADFAAVWEAGDYEVARVARKLGVSRQSVYRRVHESPDYRLASDLSLEELRDALAACGGDSRCAARALRVSFTGLRARLKDVQALAVKAASSSGSDA